MSTYSPVRHDIYLATRYADRVRKSDLRAARRAKAESGKRFGK